MTFPCRARKQRLLTHVAPFGLLALLAAPASAQEAPSAPAKDDTASQPQPDIVVTGSLLRRTDKETPSPVTVMTAETLSRAGITTISEAVRSISADGAGSIGTGFQNGFSAGGSAVSLRGLGVSSTLILIDGLRSTNFPISDDGRNSYVDLNSIPFSLIERVEVLKDGASSTYGADAIGGVVNLIFKKHITGVSGTVEAGTTEKGDGSRQRANLTVGFGDYDKSGWNVYVNGEYQRDGRIANHDRGFPYNTTDLTPIGGSDKNAADSSLTSPTPNAVVARASQGDLNNPLSGSFTPLDPNYRLLNATCFNGAGTYTQSSPAVKGTGCKYNLADQYFQIQPLQERYSFNGRLSIRLGDKVEAYATGSYSHDYVSIKRPPQAVRQIQPYGANPALSSTSPGIVLPVWICPSGVDCANPATAGRALNPNNPYAAAYANDPGNGGAAIYYLFGDIPAGSDRTNQVIRGSLGFKGSFGADWNWRVEGVGARDTIDITMRGYPNVLNLLKTINTGAYNFVDPSLNSDAVRAFVAPSKTTPSRSSMASLDASLSKTLLRLPGGPLQVAVGAQVRRETLENNSLNAAMDAYGMQSSSAYGAHTVKAVYAELDAPLLHQLEVNVSGRYDSYSEGFSHFSPKVGVKVTPFPELAFRGTYSQGFRVPTFAENGLRTQYYGFVTYDPGPAFCALHGGKQSADGKSCSTSNYYGQSYSTGQVLTGNPKLKPETSRSFTAGAIFEPAKWFSATVDYYNVKKSDLVVASPLLGNARAAYYSVSNQTFPDAAAAVKAACAAVAAVGPIYSCNTVDGVDPQFPNALPRVILINGGFQNATYAITSGIDGAATLKFGLGGGWKVTSRAEATYVIQYDLHRQDGAIQRYAGTLGPFALSAGNGTPRIRGNWQTTLESEAFSLSATVSYVGRIKEVGTDQGNLSTSCAANLYKTADKFCYVNAFINVDLNSTISVNDKFALFLNVGNVLNARAPVAPAATASAPNFLTSWHYAGLVGRKFSAGANFRF